MDYSKIRLTGCVLCLFALILHLVPAPVLLWGAVCLIWFWAALLLGFGFWCVLETFIEDRESQ